MAVSDLDVLLREATGAPFRGWDFARLEGRVFMGPLPWDFRNMVQSVAYQAEEESGLEVVGGGEADLSRTFADVGALAYYLSAIPWRVPAFDVIGDRRHLKQLHEVVTETNRPLEATSHRFWLNARKG